MALDLDPELRSLIPDEHDFDTLRGNPEFERLTIGPAPWLDPWQDTLILAPEASSLHHFSVGAAD